MKLLYPGLTFLTRLAPDKGLQNRCVRVRVLYKVLPDNVFIIVTSVAFSLSGRNLPQKNFL